VRVVDNLSSGDMNNLASLIAAGHIEFIEGDLLDSSTTRLALQGIEVVFHLAADHGGRGYLELHQAGPASNFALDGGVFLRALRAGVQKVVFASSGCVYPNSLQADPTQVVYLSEDLVTPPFDADNSYGWAKLMAEMTLRAYCEECGLQAASCRYFTAYGPRAKESHAVMAMIARAAVGQDPFQIWGTGEQIRNWTYVDDIVAGTLLAAEKIDDGAAVNIGTTERTTVLEAAKTIVSFFDYEPEFAFLPDMPTGPLNRVASNDLAWDLLGWRPETSFAAGIERTIQWYLKTKTREEALTTLQEGLMARLPVSRRDPATH
jgi:nucleoside-diphosphate-sugar epimerase